ncbi:S8 family serine peptidase [Solicola sp. PLA-1-18]|uniref:S8 family serine peptidase n=1 Tax=Solicola sp. PLA-1-18 TaxID=3380532 RepID=UPI003B7F2DAA
MTDFPHTRVALRRRVLPLALGSSLLLAVLPLGAVAAADGPRSADKTRPAEEAVVAVAAGVIVKTRSGTVSTAQRRVAAAVHGADLDGTRPAAEGTSVIAFDQTVPLASAQAVADDLESRADVLWAEPNVLRRTAATSPVTTDDPGFGELFNLWDPRSLTTTPAFPAGGYSVKAPALWRATKGVSSVTVAVVDTGMTRHVDLAASRVDGYDFVSQRPYGLTDENGDPAIDPDTGGAYPADFFANDGDGRDADPSDPGDWLAADEARACNQDPEAEAEDSSWHGTHVAGTIAATDGNGIGVVGVAPDVTVQPVRALGKCGGFDDDILDAITWASGGTVPGVPTNRTPAKVVNLSLGGTSVDEQTGRGFCPDSYQEVVDAAIARGTTVVAAAGNEAADASTSTPANCDGVVSVAATDDLGQLASYSNVGSSVTLSAPGGDNPNFTYLPGTAPAGEDDHYKTVLSTIDAGATTPTGDTYAGYAGTSMAAPAVSGAAALLYSLGAATPAQVTAALRQATQPFPAYGGGSADYDCDTSLCGAGIVDLSEVPAPTGAVTIRANGPAGTPIRTYGSVSAVAPWQGSPRLTYQWYVDGRALAGGSGGQLTIPPSAAGRKLSVAVTATQPPFPVTRRTSAGTVVGVAPTPPKKATTVSLKAVKKKVTSTKEGVQLRARGSTSRGTFTFYRGGTKIRTVRTLSNSGAISTPRRQLKPGTYRFRVVFTPADPSYAASTSRTVSVRVVKPRRR